MKKKQYPPDYFFEGSSKQQATYDNVRCIAKWIGIEDRLGIHGIHISGWLPSGMVVSGTGIDRCNRLKSPPPPPARLSGLQCYNMGHNGHGINLYDVLMILMGNLNAVDILTRGPSVLVHRVRIWCIENNLDGVIGSNDPYFP